MSNPITPELVYELLSVSSPALSAHGTCLAFVRSHVDRESMEVQSFIVTIRLADGRELQLTKGPRDTRPSFAPDGHTLAFLRRDQNDRKQLWTIPTSGGDVTQITWTVGSISEFCWSPSSDSIVFTSDVDEYQVCIEPDVQTYPEVKVVRSIRYRADTLGWREGVCRHLFVTDVTSGKVRQLTYGEGDHSSPCWSPDGSRIAFISDRHTDRELVSNTGAFVIAADGGELECYSRDLCTVAALVWSPDSSGLAIIGSDDGEVEAMWQGWVFLLSGNQKPIRITDDSMKPSAGFPPVFPPPQISWTSDGRLLFLADAKGESYLCELSLGKGVLSRVTRGANLINDVVFNADGEKAAVLITSPESAADIHIIEIDSGNQKKVTYSNDDYFKSHPAAKIKKFTLQRKGMDIQSRLFLPPNFDSNQKYPLILDIHGGPHGAFYDTFNPIQQILATAGYLVLAVNPRGSSTYGMDHLKAVISDWGGEDYLDIQYVVDRTINYAYVDESRLGIMGYSYGGYLAAWIIGHETRFQAAVIGAPCIDLSSMYGTSDIGVRFGENQWGGSRSQSIDEYIKRSPITYADNVQSPVLLMHGEDDVRCPIGQSEQYFVALKRRKKDVEFVRFPGSSHLFLRIGHPLMRYEYLSRSLAWFDKYIGAHFFSDQYGD